MADENRLWLLDLPPLELAGDVASLPGLSAWQALDGSLVRLYLQAAAAPDARWTALAPLRVIDGPSRGEAFGFHYAVETDVEPGDEAELNAWYEQEHLPGLSAVPGTVRAARYRREAGAPRYVACYDLTAPQTLERPEWLAVRHTDWSSRVRPTFRNTRRTMFRRLDGIMR